MGVRMGGPSQFPVVQKVGLVIKFKRLVAKSKRIVGISSTCGVIAFFAVPGPHTIMLIGGLVAGGAIAVATGKK